MENKSSEPRRLGAHTYHIASGGGVLVQFQSALPSESVNDVGKVSRIMVPGANTNAEIVTWGERNDLPNYREEMICGNNIVPALIERKAAIVCGQAWYAYRERYENTDSGPMRRIVDEVPMPEDAKMFFKRFKKTAFHLIGELLKHGIALPEFIRDRAGRIQRVNSLEMRYMRAGKKIGSEIRIWHWSNAWTQAQRRVIKQDDQVVTPLPVYEEGRRQNKFVLPLVQCLFNDGYYPIPSYWGGRHWIELANIIPLFHKANLRHGQLPRWNIIIPHDYFYDYEKMGMATDEEQRAELIKGFQSREQAFVDDINRVLSGLENTGRTIVTKSEMIEALGGRYEKRILIEPLDGKLNDEALLPLYAASNVANISAQAIHPSLANIETQGKLASGTEIRNAFLLYLIIAAPAYRDFLQEVIEVVKSENGWPADIHYAIRDAEMTTLAENPAGVRQAETNIAQ